MAEHGEHGDGEHKKKKGHGHGHGGGHGGGHGEEEGGAPEWLISFADMVMLMMGFFVILFALNVQPKGGNAGGGGEQEEGVANEPDFVDFAISVRKAFHTDDNLDPSNPAEKALLERMMEQAAGAGESRDDGARGKDKNVKSVRDTKFHAKGTLINFALFSTQIDEAAAATIVEFAGKQRGRNAVIEIRGHTGVSEAFRQPREAFDLSYDRALAVAEAMVAHGIEWHRLRVKAAGDNERAESDPRESTKDARNARVEILVTDDMAAPRVPTKPASGLAMPIEGATSGAKPAPEADPEANR